MKFQIRINEKINRGDWAVFLAGHPQGNIFQTPEMYDFFASVRNYRPLAIACLDERDDIQGILLAVLEREHRGILGSLSSRAIAWGGPLVGGPTREAALTKILQFFSEMLCREAIYLEIRNLHDPTELRDFFLTSGFAFKEHLNFHIKTATNDDPQKKLGSNRKRQIKKSLASGARIEEEVDGSQVDEFHYILSDLYKKKVRKPLPHRSFFENFFNSGSLLGKYFLITFNGRVIGGILCPIFMKKAIYEWYVCGLDEQYPEQYPSVMATWAAIEYAKKNGIQYFDFMGAGAPDQDYGVREFKARFGGELVNYGRFVRINNKFLFNLGKFGLKVLGKIKQI